MKLIYILVIIILAYISQCQTDLTNNNCPANFNITLSNVTKGIGRSSLANFFYSGYLGTSQKNLMQNYIIGSNTAAIQNIVIQNYLVPFLVVAVVFGIAFAIVVLCIVFQKSCPPCQSWRRDFVKRPYQKFEMRCVSLFAVIFSLAILGTAIAAFSFIPQLLNHLQEVKCSIYGTLDVAINGDNGNWGGFTHIKNQVGNISKLLNATNTEITNRFDENGDLTTIMNQMFADNINLYLSNKDAEVVSPAPVPLAANGNTKSNFIQNKLGPTSLANTMTNEIQAGLNISSKLSVQADLIQQSAYMIVNSASTIQANTVASQQLLTMYQNQLITYQAHIDAFSSSYFNAVFNWGIYVVQVVVGFVLVASLAIIIGSVSVHILDIYDCRYFLHFGWVIFGITYFGIILTAFFLLPMGSIGYNFCDYFHGMLINQTQYAKIGEFYSQNPLAKLDTCVHGDGNVLQTFNIQNQMSTVSNMFLNIQTFQAYDDPTTIQYVNSTIAPTIMNSWKTILQNYRQGKTKDNNASFTTGDDNCMVALQKMNDNTHTSCSTDLWVYNQQDCYNITATPPINVWGPPSPPQSIILNSTFTSCISLNSKLNTASTNIWSLTDIITRYIQIKITCSSEYNEITKYGDSIIKYRDSRTNLFQSLIDQLADLQNEYISFDTTLNTFRTKLGIFTSSQAITDLSNFVTNKIDGLLVSSKCTPIRDHLWFVYNSFCVNSMGSAVQLGICMLVLMCLLIGGLFTACVFAQRAATIKRLYKVHEKNFGKLEQNSIHSETFAKKEKSESSSSSSDED